MLLRVFSLALSLGFLFMANHGRYVHYVYRENLNFWVWGIFWPIISVAVGLASFYIYIPIRHKTVFASVFKRSAIGSLTVCLVIAALLTYLGSQTVLSLAELFHGEPYKTPLTVVDMKVSVITLRGDDCSDPEVLVDLAAILRNGDRVIIRQHNRNDLSSPNISICIIARDSLFGTVVDSMLQGPCASKSQLGWLFGNHSVDSLGEGA